MSAGTPLAEDPTQTGEPDSCAEPAEEHFELDRGAEGSIAALRLVAALAVTGLSVFLLVRGVGNGLRVLLGIALAICFAWFAVVLKMRARLRAASDFRLLVSRAGFSAHLGEAPIHLSWHELRGIEADEERLEILVCKRDGTTLTLPPAWRHAGRNLGMHELAHRLESRRQREARSLTSDES